MIIQTISKETRAAASRTVDLVLTRRNLLLQSNKKTPAFQQMPSSGGDEGDRTPYLLNAIQALSRHTRKRTSLHRISCNLFFSVCCLYCISFLQSAKSSLGFSVLSVLNSDRISIIRRVLFFPLGTVLSKMSRNTETYKIYH